MVININNIVVLTGKHGPDQIIMETDLPNGSWPFNGNATIRLDVAWKTGEEYVKKHFNVDPKIVKLA